MFRRHDDQEPTPTRRGRASPRRHRSQVGAPDPGGASGRSGDGADAQEQFIVEALGDLRDTVVRDIMTPRVDVVALSIPVTADAVTQAVRESGHSCFPVYDDNLDDLIGVLFVNDLFRAGWTVRSGRPDEQGSEPGPGPSESGESDGSGSSGSGGSGSEQASVPAPPGDTRNRAIPDPVDISRRLRQPFLVPESRLVLDVLAEMRRQRRAFAVVVDEHGGVEGVLTVKDLLGALVGDLPDEFDPDDEPDVVRVDGHRWLVDGRMSVDEVRDRLSIDLPDGEYVTLGGFLFDGFGHIPAEGETLTVDGWELRVAEMEKRRVAKVVAKRTAVARPEPGSGNGSGGPGNDRTAVG